MALVRRLSFLPLMRSYQARRFTSIVVRDDDLDNRNGDEQTDLDEQEDDLEDFGENDPALRAPIHSVSSTVERRPYVATQDDVAMRFRMDMPGLSKDDVRVYLDAGKLVIRGKYPELSDAQKDDVIEEDNYGRYDAEITLPTNVKVENIKSQMKHGVLHVTAPKEVTTIQID